MVLSSADKDKKKKKERSHHETGTISTGRLSGVVVANHEATTAVGLWFESFPEGDIFVWDTARVFVDCDSRRRRYRAESA